MSKDHGGKGINQTAAKNTPFTETVLSDQLIWRSKGGENERGEKKKQPTQTKPAS